MRRRRDTNARALRDEMSALVPVVYYAAALGCADRGEAWCGLSELSELARRLGVECPPSLAELAAEPSSVDRWAARNGLIRR
jgi:hypothetical protein